MMRLLRDLLLFLRRDLRIATTYRSPFVLELIEALFGAAMLYYVARFVDSPQLRAALPQGSSYFAYSLVGFVFFDYLHVALDTFDRSLEEARDAGTLEPLLVTQVSLPTILICSAVYPFVVTTLRIGVYLAWGALLFGFPIRSANWLSVLVVLIATLLAFSGLGIFSSAYLLLFKRGNPAKWFILGVSSVVGGILFPVSILPDWLQFIARLNPVTFALDAMRASILDGASFRGIVHPLFVLVLFAVVLLPTSMIAFSWALRRTKITGTLSHR
ncbi:MAG TPA: ABC transporter permease [Candidatus Limnocylindrales bacterium]|nr:ABC transporter permease [Candidatus Limnocylindrales bacterium]